LAKNLNQRTNIILARFENEDRNNVLAKLIKYLQKENEGSFFLVRNDKIVLGEKEYDYIRDDVELVIRKQVSGRHISDYSDKELDRIFGKFYATELTTLK
jgi:uncharacterized protein (DUF2164 family)